MKNTKFLTYLITEGESTSQNFPTTSKRILQKIKIGVETGVSLIQIREKQLPARLIFELTSQAVRISAHSKTNILVNDRADIALAAKAKGVQLTSNSISANFIRQNFPPDFVIGVSAHTFSQVSQAKSEGADFATFSPIFQTASKEKYGPPQGVEKLSKIVETVKDFPIIALGGIDEENFDVVLKAGATGIAAIRLFNKIESSTDLIKKIEGFMRGNE